MEIVSAMDFRANQTAFLFLAGLYKICSMNFDIIPTPGFEKSFKALAKRHRSLRRDILEFTKSLQNNPFQGDELTQGIRKILMAITSKGRGRSVVQGL